MILVTHGIAGGAIACSIPTHPVLAATFAFASHFAIDAIPHWDYPLQSISMAPGHRNSMTMDRARQRDLVLIGLDVLAGIIIPFFLFATPQSFPLVALCSTLGMLPDPLQFLHSRWPRQPLSSLQRFHRTVHTDWQLGSSVGIPSQITFCVAVTAVAVWFK